MPRFAASQDGAQPRTFPMATWTYSNWITQTDPTTKRERLALHIQEVSDAMANPQSVNSSSHGVAKFDLQAYLDGLLKREASLSRGGGVTRVRKP